MESPIEQIKEKCRTLGITPASQMLVVRTGAQTMQLFRDGKAVQAYVISTSRRPPSNVTDSLGTPLGLHAVAEKIGRDEPLGMVFKGRVPTGRISSDFSEAEQENSLITTRILRLRGLEPGVNLGGYVDSFNRYIYIHGTNRENRLGTPQSSGCILMSDLQVAELFDVAHTGDMVWIME
jgi:L,D-transpeptidase catalytic domain